MRLTLSHEARKPKCSILRPVKHCKVEVAWEHALHDDRAAIRRNKEEQNSDEKEDLRRSTWPHEVGREVGGMGALMYLIVNISWDQRSDSFVRHNDSHWQPSTETNLTALSSTRRTTSAMWQMELSHQKIASQWTWKRLKRCPSTNTYRLKYSACGTYKLLWCQWLSL